MIRGSNDYGLHEGDRIAVVPCIAAVRSVDDSLLIDMLVPDRLGIPSRLVISTNSGNPKLGTLTLLPLWMLSTPM